MNNEYDEQEDQISNREIIRLFVQEYCQDTYPALPVKKFNKEEIQKLEEEMKKAGKL